jgi:hypothetical protein
MPPHKRIPATAMTGALEDIQAAKPNVSRNKPVGGRAQALSVISTIPKSNASQLRISISTWRDERKLELRECTRLFGETFFPAGAPLTIDLDRVPQFIALLSMAVRS